MAADSRVAALRWPFWAGASIGWLTGLSASPVLATVLGALLGAVGGIVASRSQSLDMRPVAVLLVGIALLAPAGVIVRTSNILGIWAPRQTSEPPGTGVLLSVKGQTACRRFRSASREQLRSELRISGLPWARRLAEAIDDPETLESLIQDLCPE